MAVATKDAYDLARVMNGLAFAIYTVSLASTFQRFRESVEPILPKLTDSYFGSSGFSVLALGILIGLVYFAGFVVTAFSDCIRWRIKFARPEKFPEATPNTLWMEENKNILRVLFGSKDRINGTDGALTEHDYLWCAVQIIRIKRTESLAPEKFLVLHSAFFCQFIMVFICAFISTLPIASKWLGLRSDGRADSISSHLVAFIAFAIMAIVFYICSRRFMRYFIEDVYRMLRIYTIQMASGIKDSDDKSVSELVKP
jgi:hypothetical protein